MADDKDYSWLYADEKPTKGTYKPVSDGCDLGSTFGKGRGAVSFGTGNRFNPFVYVCWLGCWGRDGRGVCACSAVTLTKPTCSFMAHAPEVGRLFTDSPGPCYVPKASMGTGPSARFNLNKKNDITPEERMRLEYPGPGQYNLLLEHRLEERELIKELEVNASTPQSRPHQQGMTALTPTLRM